MEQTIKRILEKEFKANQVDMRTRVSIYAVVGNKPITYMVDCFLGDGGKSLSIRMNAQRPFEPKVMPLAFMEASKLARYCEIIVEGIKELEQYS
ncbi:hypothetical protein [Carboxylicivirga caseinilyticus]|uniref:hypothetical protein n=1 Tax=Carboxylicivirga caseinilyticus TaxID=3417572 RepID=UPI003D3553CC|nr:hypothetical protein [Marinilabiliaceae bacterium A049]